MSIFKALAKPMFGAFSRLLPTVPCLCGYQLVKIKSDRDGHLIAETHSIVRDADLDPFGKKIIFSARKARLPIERMSIC